VVHGSAAEAYERLIGRWSRAAAPAFLDFVGLAAVDRVLDLGCGTGALTRALVDRYPAATIIGLDLQHDYLQACRDAWPAPRYQFLQGDATDLPFQNRQFDAVLSMLLLMLVPDPNRVTAETLRVLCPGGIAAAATWDDLRFELIRDFWDVALALDPHAPSRNGRGHSVWPGSLAALWQSCGFTDVVEETFDLDMRFDDPADIWTALRAGVGPAGAYVAALPPARCDRLRLSLERRWAARLRSGRGFAARMLLVRGRRLPG
jgi:SAM-dependent methyltransferase